MTLSGKNWTVYVGDVIHSLSLLPASSVHCVVTSPPYWNLRDYQTGTWEGGDPACDHKTGRATRGGYEGTKQSSNAGSAPAGENAWECPKCGARRVDHQIGLEPTPAEFTAKLVEVFEQVKRVLRPDGTLWVNIGDTYFGDSPTRTTSTEAFSEEWDPSQTRSNGGKRRSAAGVEGLKPKDLCGMPWRLAFALQDAGWWLRNDIIWNKPNPMPEAVTDRFTKSHEYIFLLSKSSRYFYDADAIREKGSRTEWSNQKFKGGDLTKHHGSSIGYEPADPTAGRNCRSVWIMPTEPCREAHFATFPSALPSRCIKAGTSEKGCCGECGAPWQRATERTALTRERPNELTKRTGEAGTGNHCANTVAGVAVRTTGWEPTCECNSSEIVPCTVLDPFSGSGTTGMVATELGRRYIGCELNPEYAEISTRRIESWNRRDVAKAAAPAASQKELFE